MDKEIDDKINSLETRMNKKIDSLETRMNARFEKAEIRLNNIENDINNIVAKNNLKR